MRRRAVVTALFLGIPGAAAAQTAAPGSEEPTSDPKLAEARTAFKEGTSLARQAQWGEALLAFERSSNLRPHTFTTYNIGYCERALGRYTRARKLLARALAENDARGGTALSADVVNDAKKYLAEMDKRVARATVTLAPADASIVVDGRPLEMVAGDRTPPLFSAGTRESGVGEVPESATFDLLIDPGSHVFTVSRQWSSDLVVARTFAAGTVTPIDLKLVVKAQLSRTARGSASPRVPRNEIRPTTRLLVARRRRCRPRHRNGGRHPRDPKRAQARSGVWRESNDCPPSRDSEHDSLNRWADISTIAFSIGVVGVGLSTVLLLTSGSKRAPAPPRHRRHPRRSGYKGARDQPRLRIPLGVLTGSF